MFDIGIHCGSTTRRIEVLNNKDPISSCVFLAAIAHEPIRGQSHTFLNGRLQRDRLSRLVADTEPPKHLAAIIKSAIISRLESEARHNREVITGFGFVAVTAAERLVVVSGGDITAVKRSEWGQSNARTELCTVNTDTPLIEGVWAKASLSHAEQLIGYVYANPSMYSPQDNY